MNIDLYGHNHQKGMWEYHFEWCPKYQYKIFSNESVKVDCEKALWEAAQVIELSVLELVVMPDHVHSIADCHPSMSQSKVLNLLKGVSAREFFKCYSRFRLRCLKGHVWSLGKGGRLVGDVDKETAIDYMRKQAEQTSLVDFTKSN